MGWHPELILTPASSLSSKCLKEDFQAPRKHAQACIFATTSPIFNLVRNSIPGTRAQSLYNQAVSTLQRTLTLTVEGKSANPDRWKFCKIPNSKFHKGNPGLNSSISAENPETFTCQSRKMIDMQTTSDPDRSFCGSSLRPWLDPTGHTDQLPGFQSVQDLCPTPWWPCQCPSSNRSWRMAGDWYLTWVPSWLCFWPALCKSLVHRR